MAIGNEEANVIIRVMYAYGKDGIVIQFEGNHHVCPVIKLAS